MKDWRRRIRGAFGMALIWGAVGFIAGFGIEIIHNIWPNPIGRSVDIWPAALGLPGFFGALLFSAVVGIVGPAAPTKVAADPRALAMLRFFWSDDYFVLRKQLGLGIG